MRNLVLVCALGILGLALSSCCGSEKSTSAVGEQQKTYACTACKDKVTWMYNAKGLPTGFKTVEHNCPVCKRAWGANVGTASTCAQCAKAELMCQECLKKQGG